MDKPNVFRSSEFHLDQSDVLHVIIKNITGDGVTIALVDKATGEVEASKIVVTESELYELQDKDGNYYTVATIGDQEWIIEYLKTTTYADGVAIPEIEIAGNWIVDTSGAYCWYDNDDTTYADYGILYNWYAVDNVHGLAYFQRGGVQQEGWRIPTNTDLLTLINYLGGEALAGGPMKEALTDHWDAPNTGATNSSLFTALGTGYRTHNTGAFGFQGDFNFIWTSENYTPTQSYYVYLSNINTTCALYGNSYNAAGMSVRCVRDLTTTLRDYDGNEYTTIIIGTQEWTVENLKTTRYSNGVSIANITDNGTWAVDVIGAYAWYNNDATTYKDSYGALYNWYAVSSANGLVYFQKNGVKDDGWRIPTKTDFDILMAYMGGTDGAGGQLKEEDTTHWTTPNTGAIDTYGFTMLPSGRRFQTGSFSLIGTYGILWTNTPAAAGYAYDVTMTYNNDDVAFSASALVNLGLSVRCVRDI
jgi:uncharacterized protein (TIGR02145 family)